MSELMRGVAELPKREQEDGWYLLRNGMIDAGEQNGVLVVKNNCNLRVTAKEIEPHVRDRAFDCFEVQVRIRPLVKDLAWADEASRLIAEMIDQPGEAGEANE